MASDRQMKGYIWGEQILDHAHIEHYARAMRSDDVRTEEYWYQAVFHGKNHSKVLQSEVFHKKIRNNVTNKVEVETLVSTSNSDVVNDVLAEERKNEVKYSRVIEDDKVGNMSDYLPDATVGFSVIIREIADKCNDDEIKVLSYFVCQEHLDNILFEGNSIHSSNDRFNRTILGIWEKNVKSINDLNRFVGTRARADKARWRLCNLLKKEYPELLSGKR
ncbi:hypothetical protein EVB32_305 [Rhizobium phage RHph_TM39]|uniref:Uncharacterized protein n=2 Tax=Cuauhnahuacvirus TaxID=3044696 RepID=A0A7S5R8B6_9CAUD|nr:hypothetical protein PQC16_gp336 [Rhizobium phage RHph_TM30]YP_010671453.1 hypothetical protein PQC17_gp337 [Rhizobium phage RHph_Y65]QIG71776.1 hypothetical protein EVB94_325 [Rhizobium phage RHph_TM40]QIG72137.1 hypothetical protein EVB95_323 [Rhizobium phage RHph_TM2_3B]QIG72499.1 hypothetical protein EVB96_323 [Rhizobium phage RHph_TM3_3_6]QIG77273.1 hypothetical protein EVB32_305 [Rhizobium phage RHph_TM39]QIG77561.1 hypothetical protein EVB61_255 [Rhizobium phage RHph_TM21B]QIG77889